MLKKLFVFDMDGTLLNSKREINVSSINALNTVMDKGHEVVIATGRNFCQLSKEITFFPLMKYVITINGGIITNLFNNNETTIISQPLDKKIISEIINVAQSLKRELQWSNDKNFYRVYFGNDPWTEVDDKNFFIGGLKHKYDNWEEVKHTLFDDIVLHIAIKCEKKYVLEKIPYLREFFKKENLPCTITETSKCYLDCDPVNINKYNAVKKIQTLLNISNENTYCFGDSNNDYEMIKNSGNGVAMGNASDELKNVAKYVIGDNDSNAIADFVLGVISND